MYLQLTFLGVGTRTLLLPHISKQWSVPSGTQLHNSLHGHFRT